MEPQHQLRPQSLRKEYVTSPLVVLVVGYFAFALGLWLQPSRWANTPSYANLLNIAPQPVWGGAYFVAATLMACSLWRHRNRPLVVTAHTAAIALTTVWWLAFVIRWATDDGTTVVNVVSWGVFLALLIQSAVSLGTRRVDAH